jgi:hypothetical protein
MLANRKTLERTSHPDRDAQFKHIHQTVKAFQAADQPVISVDPKKQELVEEFKILAGSCGQRLFRRAAVSMILRFPSWAGSLPYRVYDRTQHIGKRSARRKNSNQLRHPLFRRKNAGGQLYSRHYRRDSFVESATLTE